MSQDEAPTVDTPRARARARQEKGDWEAFLAALREVPSVKRACKAAGISRNAAYKRRERHPDFAAAWKQAEEDATDELVTSMWVRARSGWRPPIDPKTGLPDANVDRPDTDAAKFLLRAHRPEVYALAIEFKHKHGLADLRSMTREQRFELGRQMGLVPSE